MNSNYQWQNHQANARLQARLREAEIHRSLKQSKEGKHSFLLFGKVVRLPAPGIGALSSDISDIKEKNKMKNMKRFAFLSLLSILVLILAACQGEAPEAVEQVAPAIEAAVEEAAPTIEAAIEEIAPTVEAAVEEAVEATAEEETAADDPDAPPLDAKLDDSRVRPADGMTMVFVPEGSFPMGRENGFSSERPVHEVSQDAFWIDSTEVTNAQYVLCVSDGNCEQAAYADDADTNGDSYPVVGVSWFDADAYCEWADARLPTEAQWEYAARGPQGLTYPWGDSLDGEKANSCDTHCPTNVRDERIDDGYKLTAPAGNFPAGESWAGALDMAGNVQEWVKDWHDEAYYANSAALNPQGPDSGERKVLRGGSMNNGAGDLRGATRDAANPDERAGDVGFRCAAASASS